MASSSRRLNRKELAVVPRSDASSRIVGTGEMADLIREFDWTKTALGGIETWSDTLITTVNLLLASRHPMFLWWGPELIQFYNDGYRPSLGADKHPSAVGQRGTECWPEIWPIIGPQIEAVMSRGDSTWNTNQLVPINRNGKLEEVFWTYGYSPVRDESSAVQGTLVVCSETTEQVLMERRLRTLLTITLDAPARIELSDPQALRRFSENVAANLQQNPADFPFACFFLFRDGEITQAANSASGPLSLPGVWPLGEVVASGTPLLLQDLPQRFGDVIRKPWPEPVTRAYLLPLRIQGESLDAVFVFGISPRLPFDEAYRTFCQLVSARVSGLIENEVHQMELARAAQRFTRLAEENPFGMVIGNLEGQLQYANSTFLNTLGYTQSDVREGRVRWNELTPPDYAEADAKAVQQIRESGRCDVYEKAYIAKDGRRVPILIGASVIDPAGHEEQVAAFVTDLTPLKQAQEALRAANDALEKKIEERTHALASSIGTLEAEIEVRKKTEQQLRELSARVLRLQDEEHRRIARDLHDSTGQTLTALKMTLATLSATFPANNQEASKLMNDLDALAGQALQEIRTLSHLLHPPMLDEVGFSSAAQWYVDEFTKRSGIRTSLRMTTQPSLTKDAETALFRVLQESLTNVVRHSGSTSVDVLVYTDASDAILSVRDYGKGIPSDKLKTFLQTAAGVGVGLGGMKQRMRDLGGHLRVDCDGTGTCIIATLPLSRA